MASSAVEPHGSEDSAELGSGVPTTLNGAPARAFVTLSQEGKNELAIWLVNFVGEACGAWRREVRSQADAVAVLQLCDRRAIIEDGPTGATLISTLADQAGIEVPDTQLKERQARLSDLLSVTAEARRAHTDLVVAYGKQEGKKLAPLAWPTELPESVAAIRSSPTRGWAGQGEAPEAFATAVISAQLLRHWTETEAARTRRTYLREQFGPSQLLPDVWRDAALAAYASPYALPSGVEKAKSKSDP